LGLSAKSASHSAMFFSHNKSANSTFSHDLSAKRIGRTRLIIRLSHQKLSTESADGNESKPRGKLGSIARIVLEGKKETTTVVLKQGLSVGFPYHYPQ
jgi:hypothetical protein